MIEDIGRRFSVDLAHVPAVGDSLRDLDAFYNAGCQPILVRSGKGEETLANGGFPPITWLCDDLADAAQRIIAEY